MRYPIGKFVLPDHATAATKRTEYIKNIGELPAVVAGLAEELKRHDLLDTPYREGGWTTRQVIHHLADSHMNAYVRHKRILSEDHPTMRPYDEARWAEMADVTATPIAASLEVLRGMHLRWATLLATCSNAEWERTGYHSGSGITYRLDTLAATYSWHGLHHVGHLRLVL
ncbi:MAG: hypothetical protein ACJATN_000728 [Neolewinella sp.]|jgi:hypothetical protein